MSTSYYSNGKIIGYHWKIIGDSLIFSRIDIFPTHSKAHLDMTDTVIINLKTSHVIVSDQIVYEYFYKKARYGQIVDIEFQDCFAVPKVSPLKGTYFKYKVSDESSQILYEHGEAKKYPLCDEESTSWNTQNPDTVLKAWFQTQKFFKGNFDFYTEPFEEELSKDATPLLSDVQVVNETERIYKTKFFNQDSEFKFHLYRFSKDYAIAGVIGMHLIKEDEKPLPILPHLKTPVSKIYGYMNPQGLLEDTVIIYFEDKRVFNGKMKEGVLHGAFYVAGQVPLFPLAEVHYYMII